MSGLIWFYNSCILIFKVAGYFFMSVQDQLRLWIESNIAICAQSMFIFDEVDKLPAKLLDVIKPYIDYYEHLAGVNYRKSIFIFLRWVIFIFFGGNIFIT
jgi:hypothetical protein